MQPAEKKQRTETVMDIPVVLIGVGQVGRALIRQITAARELHKTRYGVAFQICAVCDSSGCVASDSASSPLSDETIESVVAWKQEGKRLSAHSLVSKASYSDTIQRLSGARTIFADCSATDVVYKDLLYNLNKGGGAVLCNKKPLADTTQSVFKDMTTASNRHRIRYESTVGAGTPMIAALTRIINSGDKIKRIEGTFSGTLGYVMTELQTGTPYSEIVNEAANLGYTEPDPRDDLAGTDVGRKACILARTMGWEIEMKDVQIEPLFTANLAALSVPEFLKSLNALDDEYKQKSAAADAENKVLRYTALLQDGKAEVGLKALDKDSPIGRLQGTANMCAIYTEWYGESPIVVQGAGAGGDVTAAGMLGDMVELASVL